MFCGATRQQHVHRCLRGNRANFDATGAGVVKLRISITIARLTSFLQGSSVGASIYLIARRKIHAIRRDRFQKGKSATGRGVIAFDFDKDGWMDLAFTHAGARASVCGATSRASALSE